MLLHGHRLEGEWALVPASLDGKERNWLIVRAAKEHAAGPAITVRADAAAGRQTGAERSGLGVRDRVGGRACDRPGRGRPGALRA